MKKNSGLLSFLPFLFLSLAFILFTSCPTPMGIGGTVIPPYSISVDNVNPADGGEYVVADVDSAIAGTTVTLTAHVNSGRMVTLAVPNATVTPSVITVDNSTAVFTMPASATEVTATFSAAAATYTVSYNANGATGGTAPVDQTKIENVNLQLASNSGSLVKTGYDFDGWNTNSEGTGTDYAVEATYSNNGNITLYAKWTANTYTVTFDAGAGATPSPETKDVTYNSTYGTLASTSRTGYTFGGWWTGSGGTGSQITSASTVAILSAQTLYAKWTAKTYTVTFDAGDGITPSPETKSVTYDAAYGVLATTSRSGYNFAGWWTGAGGTGSQISDISTVTTASDHTLYAKWTDAALPTYTVTFNANGADSGSVPSSQTKTEGIDLTLASNTGNLGLTDHNFEGWNTSSDGNGTDYAEGATYSSDADITLYAKWAEVPTYTVTYDANGADSGTVPSSQTKTESIDLTLASNTGNLGLTDHTFEGWNTSSDGNGTDYIEGATYSSDADITLYAKWAEVPTYTVTYNANGADSGTVPSSQTKTESIDLTLASNTGNLGLTDHNFEGWNTSSDGNGTDYAEGATYSTDADITLYAKWAEVPTYTVTYDANGADSGTVPSSQTKTESIDLTLASNTGNLGLTDHTFEGWNTSSDGNGTDYIEGATYSSDADITLYAKWAEVQTYTVTYDANGADSGTVPSSQTKTESIDLTLASNTGNLGLTDHTFEGWNTSSDGNGTDYIEGATYSTDSDITLYAKWVEIPTYTVTYDANGADSGTIPSSQTKTVGIDLTLADNTGGLGLALHSLSGWNTTAEGDGDHYELEGTYTADADAILYAEWTAD